MRVEVRKSGGDTCPTCGAFELVTTKLGKEVAVDFALSVEREWKTREAELRAEFEQRLREHGEESQARAYAARTAVTRLEQHHEELHQLAADGMAAMVGTDYRKFRFRARKRRRVLLAQAQPVLDQLIADTRKV